MNKAILIASIFLGAAYNSVAKPTSNDLPFGYYMVVAAYAPSAEGYALKLVEKLQEKGIEANYGFSKTKNLFFVYSTKYNSRSEALGAIKSERERTGESKAWVYVNNSGVDSKKNDESNTPSIIEEKEEVIEETKIEKNSTLKEAEESAPPKEIIEEVKNENLEEEQTPISHQGMTYLFIEATDATTGKPLEIDFEVVDLARKVEIARTQSNHSFPLSEPTSASKMIQVQSNDVAWQAQSFDFKYYEPIIDPISIFLDNLGDTTFVKFEMKPIKKGDIVTLYKVFFFKDASIMMAKSEYELEQVLSLMNNNPTVKIVIHGHTNGGSAGKIIALKEDGDIDFFNINGDHRELSGTASKLSAERASIVKRYLTSNGIDPSRLSIKGWGGKKMIYDKHSPEARYNVRVEIEVVE